MTDEELELVRTQYGPDSLTWGEPGTHTVNLLLAEVDRLREQWATVEIEIEKSCNAIRDETQPLVKQIVDEGITAFETGLEALLADAISRSATLKWLEFNKNKLLGLGSMTEAAAGHNALESVQRFVESMPPIGSETL